ncbi:hypothetical protein [Microbacterium sp. MMO-113]|uniref:hypothetical protein n=1 Tax=Microbacterium sp. MMO-113 TaxID=3081273 RepID=UPI003015DF49
MNMGTSDRTLFLYTSNIRERYVTDALAAVAHPNGARIRFRYDRRHVSEELRSEWLRSTGLSALIHLSLQHPQRFHESAFIPLRLATVVGASEHGEILSIDLELGDYFTFLGLPVGAEPDKTQRLELGHRIREYSKLLRTSSQYPSPDDDVPHSAGFGPAASSFNNDLEETKLPLSSGNDAAFRAIVDYLSSTLTNPERFYFRVVGIRDIGTGEFVGAKDGEFWLTTGHSYILEIFHRQESLGMIPSELRLAVGEGLSARDVESLTLTSAYDAFSVFIDVPNRPDSTRSYLEVGPRIPSEAASIRLNVVLGPSNAQKYAIPVAGAVAAGAVAFAATDLVPKDGWGAGFSVALAGAVFGLGLWQTKRGLKILP